MRANGEKSWHEVAALLAIGASRAPGAGK
jgi:hypothetical protein